MNLLYVTGKLDYTDGVTSHLYNLLSELSIDSSLNISLICTGGEAAERFYELGINVHEDISLDHGKRNPVNFLKSVKTVNRIIRENKSDIVHSHNHYAANISEYAATFSSAKTVQTIHGIIPEGGMLNHFKAQKIITVNHESENFIITIGIRKATDVVCIYQGIEDKGNPIKEKGDKIKIICASRLIYEKGIDDFIRAVNILGDKYKDKAEFIIAGKGDYEKNLKEMDSELRTDITFAGEIKNLPEYMNDTDIFVMPSRSSSEGFPMTIAEAAFAGNFLIISDTIPVKNIFENKTDGYIFKSGNPEDLADKISEALDNPGTTSNIAQNFLSKSKKIFNLKIMAEKHLKLYRECLKKK